MDLFLDTSVLLSACASTSGASRFIVESAKDYHWALSSAHYCREEAIRNLNKLGGSADDYFTKHLDKQIHWQLNALTSDDIILFEVDFRRMESTIIPNLYFAGECLDFDGITGGFIFRAAWTTGRIAGQAISEA